MIEPAILRIRRRSETIYGREVGGLLNKETELLWFRDFEVLQKSLWGPPTKITTPTVPQLFFWGPQNKVHAILTQKKRWKNIQRFHPLPFGRFMKFILWAQKFILKSLHRKHQKFTVHLCHIQKTNRVQMFLLSKRVYIDECKWHLSLFFRCLSCWCLNLGKKLSLQQIEPSNPPSKRPPSS